MKISTILVIVSYILSCIFVTLSSSVKDSAILLSLFIFATIVSLCIFLYELYYTKTCYNNIWKKIDVPLHESCNCLIYLNERLNNQHIFPARFFIDSRKNTYFQILTTPHKIYDAEKAKKFIKFYCVLEDLDTTFL